MLANQSAVPNLYEPNIQLSNWVRRQRYQYKLRKAGKPSTLTDARIEALQSAGFIWEMLANQSAVKKPDLVKPKPTKKSNKSKLNAGVQDIEIEQLPNTTCKKICDSHALQWSTKFRDFLEFKKEHGHTGMFLSDEM
jgi:hypothetical protein